MAAAGSNPSPAPSRPRPPPRALEVGRFAKARAPELASLHEIISKRLGGDFNIRRGKRRRTNSHLAPKGRRRKRPRFGDGGGQEDPAVAEGEEVEEKKLSRRARRRKEFQKNPDSGFSAAGDGTKRLRTHLWHAKRFTMVKRWGFYLPLGLSGKGRGSRAVFRWLKSGALVHDSSYCCPIQLEGPEASIMEILGMVLRPVLPDVVAMASPVFSGGVYENAMLYHAETHFSQPIAPVMYMWRPISGIQEHVNSGVCSNNNPGQAECMTTDRQLWVWIHSAAYDEGFRELCDACEKQMQEKGVRVSCFSLDGRFGRLDVMGSQAIQAIRKIMHPLSELPEKSDHTLSRCWHMSACSNGQSQKSSVLDHAEKLPAHTVLTLLVHDPRDLPDTDVAHANPLENAVIEEELRDAETDGSCIAVDNEIPTKPSTSEASEVFLSYSKSLWDLGDKFRPPTQGHVLCTEKRNRRLKFFYLDWLDNSVPSPDAEGVSVRSCPVFLVKHAAEEQSFCMGWSIILPMSWVRVFWTSLISVGARAIGSRERRWIACNNELPCFPYDFPDCKAYSVFMAAESAASERSAMLRPPASRLPSSPATPPWASLISSLRRRDAMLHIMRKLHSVDAPPSLLEDSYTRKQTPSEQAGGCFPGFIPRTSDAMRDCLLENGDGSILQHMRSSIELSNGSNTAGKRLVGGLDSLVHNKSSPTTLVRVLLCARKKGVFEQGAMVCVPTEADELQWKSRSEEDFQIPTSSAELYFRKGESENWELHLPSPVSTPAYRWPLGFVTSGFVYGSSKPVAIALCGAEPLALLRRRQRDLLGKDSSDVLVLVCNPRSSTFRRATATVVLDRKEDLKFM